MVPHGTIKSKAQIFFKKKQTEKQHPNTRLKGIFIL